MESYNFWADLLGTYRALPDTIKALWVVTPPGFVLGLIALLRRRPRPPAHPPASQPEPVRYIETENGTLVMLEGERRKCEAQMER